MRRAGKIDDQLPDVDVRTGTLSAKLDSLPGPERQRVTDQFDELDDASRRYLGDSDLDHPAVAAADLFKNTGSDGRRALNALAETDEEAADVLLEIDDPEVQWRFVRAFDGGEAAAKLIGDRDGNGVTVVNDAADLAESDGQGTALLSDDQVNDLIVSYENYDDASIATRDVRSVQDDIDRLANVDSDGLDGLREAINHGTGSNTGMKGLDGEVDAATTLLDNDDVTVNALELDEEDGITASIDGTTRESEIDRRVPATTLQSRPQRRWWRAVATNCRIRRRPISTPVDRYSEHMMGFH